MVYELEGKPVVRNLDAKNGTYVNGYAIDQAVMMPEDFFRVGMTQFVVAYNAPASTSPDAPDALAALAGETF